MNDDDLEALGTSQLVERFQEFALSQYKAELFGRIAAYTHLFDRIVAIRDELNRRPGDQRSALVALFTHQNPQVRLMAAQFALAVAPISAQDVLRQISDRNEYPQAAYARQSLEAIARGDSKLT